MRKPIVENIAVGATVTETLKSIVELSDDAVDAWYGHEFDHGNSTPIQLVLTVEFFEDQDESQLILPTQEAMQKVQTFFSSTTRTTTMLALELLAPMQRSSISIIQFAAAPPCICRSFASRSAMFCLSLHLSDFLCEDVKK